MMGKTHVALSLSAAVIASNYLNVNLENCFYVGLVIGSTLPDVDLKTLVKPEKDSIFEHRGITHTPIFLIGLWFALSFISNRLNLNASSYISGITIGAFLHIIEDLFTPLGSPILFPLLPIDEKISLNLLSTNSIKEKLLFICCMCFLIFTFRYHIPMIDKIYSLPNVVINFISQFKRFTL